MQHLPRSAKLRIVLLLLAIGGLPQVAAAASMKTGGTGAMAETLKRLGGAFTATEKDIEFEVIPSFGSGGGIKAVADGVLDFAVSGRALKAEEKAGGLKELSLVRTPYVLATSAREPQSLKSAEVAEFFANPKSTWKNGTSVKVTLRPKSDSDTPQLGNTFPGMHAAIETVRNRSDVPIAATDQDNAEMAEKLPGSLVGATYTQILMEQRRLQVVPIDGVKATIEAFESGAYPYGKTFTFVFPAQPSPAVDRFIAFLRSPAAIPVLRQTLNLQNTP